MLQTRRFLNFIKNKGNTIGDINGKYAILNKRREKSVIYYTIVNNAALKKVLNFQVEEITDSDHQPITQIKPNI